VTGRLSVRLAANPTLALFLSVAAFDDAQQPIVQDASLFSEPLGLRVTAGRTYYVQVSSSGSTGRYLLSLASEPDDFGDDFDLAEPLVPSADGSGAQAGAIEVINDLDTFRFVAPVTGRVVVRLEGTPQQNLSLAAAAFDEARQGLGSSTFGVLYSIPAVAGRTYFVQVRTFQVTSGYQLSLATPPDDFGDEIERAAPLGLSADGSGVQAGALEAPDDVDTFRYVAPATGRLTAVLAAAAGSSLRSALTVFGGDGSRLGGGEDGQGDQVNRAAVDVTAGQIYYLRVDAPPVPPFARSGSYTLTLSLRNLLSGREVEPNDTLATAAEVDPGGVTAGLLVPGDVDLFAFRPTREGRFTARVRADGGDTRLSLLDRQGRLLVQSDGISPDNREDRIEQHLPAGTYYLKVEGLGGASDYALETELVEASFPIVETPPEVGDGPADLVAGDFDGDGRLDLATANRDSDDVSVLRGRGDGTFRDQVASAVGDRPREILAADFNNDGRPDLATANAREISVLLGRGDGTFQVPVRIEGTGSLAGGDFDGDGYLDLVTADGSADDVSVRLGRGDGTFRDPVRSAGGGVPVVGDFDGDDRLDLATANLVSDTVLVRLGRGDGTFRDPVPFAVGDGPGEIVAGDFDGDGRLDLATANIVSNDASVLLGRGNGTFLDSVSFAVGDRPGEIVADDFDGDGRIDLAIGSTSIFRSRGVLVLPGLGDGTFRAPVSLMEGSRPEAIVAGDFNGDGRPDIGAPLFFSDNVSVSLNLGDGTFAFPGPLATAIDANASVIDLDRDGTDDVLILNQAGEILWRKGRPQEPGTFEPPIVVNPGVPARDIAAFASHQGPLVAAVDARSAAVSLFTRRDGRFVRIGSLLTGRLPAQVATADLDGDGDTDLLVRNAGDGTASLYFGDGFGNFRKGLDDLPIGLGASDVRLADVDQSGSIDLIVTNQTTGDVRILSNRGDATFVHESRYHAADGLYGLFGGGDTSTLRSSEATAGVALGTFTRRIVPGVATVNPLPILDLVTINPGSSTLGVLGGLGRGAFANPRRVVTNEPARVIRADDFNGDGVTDVALLGSSQVTIAQGDGRGGFAAPLTLDAGPNPTGLSVADVDQDGELDLLIGNDFGDLLILRGDGDGTFRTFQEADRGVALAVEDLDGDGRKDFVFASQDRDRVVVELGGADSVVVDDRSNGLIAPGAVVLSDLNGDGSQDLVVANSGSNNVLIYPGLGAGRFGPALNGGGGFFAGTNPVAITVADFDVNVAAPDGRGDGIPDLVVTNRGSNDVSILLGRGTGAAYTLVPGPRLRAGLGPVGTVVEDVVGDRQPDIVVSNGLSGDVRLIAGRGRGFFADREAAIIPVGNDPGPPILINSGNRDGPGIVLPNPSSDTFTVIPDFVGGIPQSIPSGGQRPVAVLSDDFNADGFFDAVVANNGDGQLALFLGGDEGLSLGQILTSPDLPHPTALALDSFGDGRLSVYASTEGIEAAALLTFLLGNPVLPPIPPAPNSAQLMVPIPAPPGGNPLIPSLVSLTDSALTLIATLLTVSLDTRATPIDAASSRDETSTPLPPPAAANPPAQAAAGSAPPDGGCGRDRCVGRPTGRRRRPLPGDVALGPSPRRPGRGARAESPRLAR
jgi:hypothetical protein